MDGFKDLSPHRPLSQPEEIRVVKLHPGASDHPIVCTLEHVRLGEHGGNTTTPDYIAVSYVWGDPAETRPIALDSAPSYPVTLNLFSALTHLRDEGNQVCLWIDSLCINQQDLAERSAQVSRMRDIYASAAEVRVWLGDYGDISKPDWRLGLKYACESAKRVMHPVKTILERLQYDDLTHSQLARGRDVMDQLLIRPWFTRMWVVQEVAVRHLEDDDEKVRMMVGDLTVPWFVMYNAFHHARYIRPRGNDSVLAERLSCRSGLYSIAQAWNNKMALTRFASQDEYFSLAKQLALSLSLFTLFGATDPRDRIYSLLGLLVGNESIPGHLAPDYSKPVDRVYHEYVAWMLREDTGIDLLGLSTGPQPGRPSWVPNLAGRRGVFCRSLDDTNPARLLDNDALLEIEALPITTIVAVENRCNIHEERQQTTPGSAAEAGRILAEHCRRYLLECEGLIERAMDEQASGGARRRNRLRDRCSGWWKNRQWAGWKDKVKQARQHKVSVHASDDTSVEGRFGTGLKGSASSLQQPDKDDVPEELQLETNPHRQRLSQYFAGSFAVSLKDYYRAPPLPWETLYEVLMRRPFSADATDEEIPLPGFVTSTYPREDVVQPLAGSIADEFDGYAFFVCENGDVDFCRSTSIAPEPGDMLCLLRGSTKRYILRPVAGNRGQWTMIGTAYMDAEFSLAWHRNQPDGGGATGEGEMRQSWAAMWKEKREGGNVMTIVIR
ncbi:HET-domain-containing protein [Parathielavia hyrcaniae]|uniref:HET-domain-containing protein n=1 Tax=Parathielavia hyrcaniae TaxID=113614 RepID=A0AAN6SYQ4_9PEZI|nr:HET-domain-containing protein [Parathielavia hyrcaniae]